MSAEEHTLEAPDGHSIPVYFWASEGDRGLVQIAHGMAEHASRYEALAGHLVEHGWSVIAHDHRGHGKSVKKGDVLGHFADREGWTRVLEDLRQVRAFGRERASAGQLCLFGHSMGSFISMSDQIDAPGGVDLLVLSGSNAGGGALASAGLWIAKLERLRQGRRGKSGLVAYLSFGSFNKPFEPARTEFDWLSRDPEQVDLYVNDPLCGFRCTNQLWIDLIETLLMLGKTSQLARIPSEVPIYLFSGRRDPVSGKNAEGVDRLTAQLREGGARDVEERIYEDGRHEMLNDVVRDEVMADLTSWLDRHRPSSA